MISLLDVKNYLWIVDDEDDAFILSAITAGYDYLANAVDDFDILKASDASFQRLADMWILTQWIPAAYDEREGMHSEAPSLNYTARAMLTQLQLYEYERED